MSAIDQRKQLYALRTTMIEKRIERGARGPPGIKDVVNEDYVHVLNICAKFRFVDLRIDSDGGKVVAVKSDVEYAARHGFTLNTFNDLCQPIGDRNTAPLDADEHKIVYAVVLLDDLVGKTHQGAFDLRSRHELRFLAQIRLSGSVGSHPRHDTQADGKGQGGLPQASSF